MWQAELDPFENGGIHEEERTSSWVHAIIGAHGFTFLTRQNRYIRVVLPPEDTTLLISFTLPVRYYILVGGEFGGFR